jgi:hypothetical protein
MLGVDSQVDGIVTNGSGTAWFEIVFGRDDTKWDVVNGKWRTNRDLNLGPHVVDKRLFDRLLGLNLS